MLACEDVAKRIQLAIKYDPEPPYRSGHPDRAEPAIVAEVRRRFDALVRERTLQLNGVVARWP